MNKKSKITLVLLSTVLLAAVILIAVTLLNRNSTVFGEYNHDSSLRWYETIEDIVIDGKNDDGSWANINPYTRETTIENRDSVKYKGLEPKIQECTASVYTHLGEKGLFIYATTDEPVINRTVLSPFATTAFDFYISDQRALNKLGNLFNIAISADNNVKLRVRDKDSTTGKEAWVGGPNIGIKSETAMNKKGYSVEMFIPWSTLNIEEKPECLQMATALSRRIDETDTSERFWEMFDYYTGPINMINSSTFPIFDKDGYVEFEKGENFSFVHSNIIDFSEDKGENPKVTTLNRNTVTAYLDKEPVKDVYWETTIEINDFNYTDDPRVGVFLEGEEKEDGTYDRVYLMLELDKKHEGEGYTIKDLLMLPHSNGKNNWDAMQYYIVNSQLKNGEFKLAILKQNDKFYFYLNDVLLSIHDSVQNFTADTKVTCGITSWYVGATFSDYKMVTTDLNAVKAEKTRTLVSDENMWAIRMDLLTQKKGYIWADTTISNQSIVNFNQNVSGDFYVTTTLSDLTSYKNASDSRNGIVFTKNLGNDKYRRIYFTLVGGADGNFKNLQILMIDNDDFGDNWSKVGWIEWPGISKRNKAELSVAVVDNNAVVYIDGKIATSFSLADYNMQNPDKVGFTSWKGKVKFSNYALTTESKDMASVVTELSINKSQLLLSETASTDIYAETKVKISEVMNDVWPRVGLRLTNEEGKNIDFVLYYNKKQTLANWALVVPGDAEGKDIGTKQYYAIDSAINSVASEGVKLGVAKKGDTLYFYVNDVLQGTKKFEGFGAESKVTASLYSKYTESTFTNYGVKTDSGEIDSTMASLHDIFVADAKKETIYFDLLNEANPNEAKITTNESGAWKESSIVNWNGISDKKFYVEATIELTGSNTNSPAQAGIVLTSGENRFFVMLYGSEKGITDLGYYSMTGDIFDNYDEAKYPNGKVGNWDTVSLSGKIKIGVYRDGEQLIVLINDKVQRMVDLSTVKYPITGDTTVGFTGWKARAEFTKYNISTDSAVPIVTFDGGESFKDNWKYWKNWALIGKYNAKKNIIALEFGKTDASNSKQLLALNNIASSEIYAETTIQVSKVANDVWPRAGLRLTNGEGKNLDFVLYYNQSQKLNKYALVVPVDEEGMDYGTKQYYAIDSAVKDVSDKGIKLAVAKDGETLSFYVNDVLLGRKTYEGFGANAGVTASLYSKYTESSFVDYSVSTTDIEVETEGLHDTFVADEKKTSIYFDVLGDADASMQKITTNETDTWANHSIINWNDAPTDQFLAEATVEITGRNDSGNVQAGFVLTSGENRYYVMVYGTETGVTYLGYHSMSGDNFDGRVSDWSGKLSLTNKNKLAIRRDGTQLTVLLNGEVQKEIDLSKADYPITGDTKVGLAAWKAKAVFTEYQVKSIIFDSDIEKGTDVSKLNQTATTDIFAETTVKVSDVKSEVFPRVGLRLTNKDRKNVDFVLYYNTNKTLQGWAMVVPVGADGKDGIKQYYAIDSAMQSVSDAGIKLAIAKKGATIYFYVNDVLQGTKTYEGFGVSDAVTASLYSKYTESSFSDFSAEISNTMINDKMEAAYDTFVADEKKSSIYFDILKAENVSTPMITTNETDTWANSSIVNWNVASTDKFFAETTIELTGRNDGGNVQAGFVLTSGENRYYVMVYGTETGVTYLGYHSMSGDNFDGKVSDWSGKLSLTNKNKLAIRKDGTQLTVLLNGEVQKEIDLSKVTYPIAGDTKVGFAAWKAKATFTEYQIKELQSFHSDLEKSTDGVILREAISTDFYAETTVKVSDVKSGKWPRIGLRLTNQDGETVDFVLYYNQNKVFQDYPMIVYKPAGQSEKQAWGTKDTTLAGIVSTKGVNLAVKREGADLCFYVNGVLLKDYDDPNKTIYKYFDANDTITVNLYSQYTEGVFTDYDVKTVK